MKTLEKQEYRISRQLIAREKYTLKRSVVDPAQIIVDDCTNRTGHASFIDRGENGFVIYCPNCKQIMNIASTGGKL